MIEEAQALTGVEIERTYVDKGYLHDLTDGFKAERVIGDWIDCYNTERPHSALAGQTAVEAYGAEWPVDMMDKAIALPTSPHPHRLNNRNRM